MHRALPLLMSVILSGPVALAEVAPPKPAESKPTESKPADAAAKPAEAAKPDPLAAIKAETAKLVAERERIAAQVALEQTKLDEKLAPRKRALAEIQNSNGRDESEAGPRRGRATHKR